MLYHLNEFRKAALIPVEKWAEANDLFLQWTGNDNPISRTFKASNEIVKRTALQSLKPTFGIKKVECEFKHQPKIFSIKEHVVFKKSFCELRHFSKQESINQPKMLIVAPLSGHFSTLLRDTVQTCLKDFDVYITDWTDARLVPLKEGDFSLDDYIDYILDFMRFLGEDVHILAVCQPAVPVLITTALLETYEEPCSPASIILMGGPIDTRINPGPVDEFANTYSLDWFKRNIINTIPSYYPGAGRKVSPGFIMLNGFMLLDIKRHQEASWKLFENLIIGDEDEVEKHQKFYDEYRSVMDLPATYFLDSIRNVFQEHLLPKGKFKWRGYPIQLENIKKTWLLTIEGERDIISSPGQTEITHKLCFNIPKNHKAHYLQEGVGHYGIFNGSKWRQVIYPKIAEFCKKARRN